MRADQHDTEVDAYVFIKESLKEHGWDTRNPSRVSEGQVWTQNECLGHPEIKRLFGKNRPENIVKVSDTVLWVIEAKRSRTQLKAALDDAYGRADTLNVSRQFQVKFISGVAGNDTDGFIVHTEYLHKGRFHPVRWNGVPVTGFLSEDDLKFILNQNAPDVANPKIDEALFISKASKINEILHLGAVNPHQRASVMAALLLSMLSDTEPNVAEKSPKVLIRDINARVEFVLAKQGKSEFFDYIKIALPATEDNHVKFRQALVDSFQQLTDLNIKSAMNSGDDWLGAFYEVFLKYASWAQDLGIVLTPRHLTKWAAEVMDVQSHDIVYDPTCGTGGFLVAAFDHVKQSGNQRQVERFKQQGLFGVEQETGLAALAVVNMIFRGDGKNNIKEGNCFAQTLEATDQSGSRAQFIKGVSSEPPVTKVLMNPPFSLRRGSEKEYKFVDQALAQMEDGGMLFAILPYSAMCKPKGYDKWRKEQLLPRHTLRAVVSFPSDVFYPIGVTTVGVFIEKGTAHPKAQPVLWVRAASDGLVKSKGKRLPNRNEPNTLMKAIPNLKRFLQDPNYVVRNLRQFQKIAPIDWDDPQLELVPEAYLDQALPQPTELFSTLERTMRYLLAYLIKVAHPILSSANQSKPVSLPDPEWGMFAITDLFQLGRGDFHSLTVLDKGGYPTISRVSTDNGCVGFYDKPRGAEVYPARTITVSSVTGDAFVQPLSFIATDNVVLCHLRPEYAALRLSSLLFIQTMMNHTKWRYSYGRQCYKTKYAKTHIFLPRQSNGFLDEDYMERVVKQAGYWQLIKQQEFAQE